MTLFQDNLSPYLTVVEQGSTPATPSAGDQKLFVRSSDHLLCYVNSSGVVTPVSASSALLTTKGDLFGFSTVAARVPVGADGDVLTADSTQTLGLKWAAAAGGIASASQIILTDESTSSATYTDLATVGPAATVTVGASGIVLVGWRAQIGATGTYMSVAVSGANTIAASDDWMLLAPGAPAAIGTSRMFTGLTPGSTTFTAKYRVGSGTYDWQRRELWALAL